ncbi:hypothetical protein D3C78_1780410 [compost metagenome]
MIMSASEDYLSWETLKVQLSSLLQAVSDDDYVRVRQLLRESVSGYSPGDEIVDLVYQQRRLEK